jgi:RNA polymerase sigma-70 factor (ECF subfamily)
MAHPVRVIDAADEAALIKRITAGATEEFSVIVEQYQNQVYGVILRQVGNQATARDLAQETFVKAYKSLHTFRAESALSTWLTRIALNVTSSYFESKSYKQSLASEEFTPERHDIASTPPDTTTENQATKVRAAISTLPAKYRDVVALLALEEQPREQVAKTLGIPVGTVASRFHKAIGLLKKKLSDGGAI